MPGTFLLLGSGEFEPWSLSPERSALAGAPGADVLVVPTASAPEGDDVFDGWATMGLDHYAEAGIPARVLPLKTRADADRDEVIGALAGAGMAFFSGGDPRYLRRTLEGTRFREAMAAALAAGTVFAGCSAGAIAAGAAPDGTPPAEHRPSRFGTEWMWGLGLVPHAVFGAHWDRLPHMAPGLRSFFADRRPPGTWFVGIDERTAILGDGASWTTFGRGGVEVRSDDGIHRFAEGDRFATPPPPGA